MIFSLFFLQLFFYYDLKFARSIPTTFIFLMWISAITGFAIAHHELSLFYEPYPLRLELSDIQEYKRIFGVNTNDRLTDLQVIEIYHDSYWNAFFAQNFRHVLYSLFLFNSACALAALLMVTFDGRDLWPPF